MKKEENEEYEVRMFQLREIIVKFLTNRVTKPSLETIDKDFHAQDQLANFLLIVRTVTDLVKEKGLDFDKHFLSSLPPVEIEKRLKSFRRFLESGESRPLAAGGLHKDAYNYLAFDSSQKELLSYFGREIEWIVVSILSGSYISALVLMRSVFELLVGIATRETQTMKSRINSIPFMKQKEKQDLLKLWNRLCGWAHPYGRWVKKVCPIFIEHLPRYHPMLCATCIQELQQLIDFFILVALEKYEIPAEEYFSKIRQHKIPLSGLKLVSSRRLA